MGFQQAKMEQAALKVVLYGTPGSGKTYTALSVAAGIGGQIAVIDTEHGSDFYANRWTFDVLHTRSVVEIKAELPAYLEANPDVGCVIVDSITHVWEECQNAYRARLASQGKDRELSFGDWPKIKRPYRELMTYLLNLDRHVFLCGRLGMDYEVKKNRDVVKAGEKIRAESDTAYESHIVVKMVQQNGKHIAFVEKDRSGLIDGRKFINPGFDMFRPIMEVLGDHQAQIGSDDEAAEVDEVLFSVVNGMVDGMEGCESLRDLQKWWSSHREEIRGLPDSERGKVLDAKEKVKNRLSKAA